MSRLINRIAPDFTLPLVGGGRMNLAELRGQIIVLNFWSAECPWSKRADVVLVYKGLSWVRQGVRIVGIASNVSETESEIQQEVAARLVTYPIMQDVGLVAAELYEAVTTPHFFVLDRQGIVRYEGALDNATFKERRPTEFFLVRAVEALLAGGKPDPEVTKPYGCTIVRHALTKKISTSTLVRPEAGQETKPEAPPDEPNWGGWD
jgi:peroxiredoxin